MTAGWIARPVTGRLRLLSSGTRLLFGVGDYGTGLYGDVFLTPVAGSGYIAGGVSGGISQPGTGAVA